MNFKIFAAAFLFMALAGFVASAPAQAETTAQTTDFVHQASAGNTFEIGSSNLALKQTSSKDVKAFAEKMLADHTKISDQLKKVLASSDTGLSVTDKLDDTQQKTINELKAASADNFDNIYIQSQNIAHDGAVTLFTNYAKNGDNAGLKAFASNTLPILKEHQQMARALNRGYMTSHQ